jgi:cardiolipin synthase
MKPLLLLAYFAGWALIPHLLLLKKRPTATLAWLWAIIFIPWLGSLAYLLFGTDRLKRRRLRRRNLFSARTSRRRFPDGGRDPTTDQVLAGLPRRDRQFLRLLSRINQIPASSGSELRILRNADEFYPALAARIRAARDHIHIEFYIWQPDDVGREFLALLTDAARRGVKVRLLLDGVGSHDLDEDLVAELRAAGGQFSWFQSLDPRRNRFFLNLRNHRKLQIVDGSTAFVGGMNIGGEYRGLDPELGHWRDIQVEVSGVTA